MALDSNRRYYPSHPVGKPVDPNKLNTDFRTTLDNVYDLQGAVQAMTGGATALAQISGGGIVSVVPMYPGFGYSTAPQVTISGDGSGAKATAQVANGRVVSFTMVSPGAGYTHATVTLSQ